MNALISKPAQYLALTKPKVVALIVFTAIVGMLLATPGWPDWRLVGVASLGIWLASSSAAAINHLLDARIDAVMARTANRPLPTGQLSSRQVLVFALALGVASMVLLVWQVNVLTAVLTFFALIGYAVIYTMFLKRATPQNIVLGGAAGAAPPVLGWAAIDNAVHPHALLMFLIIFIWTPPHFWALAIFRREDYARAAIPMLPITHGVEYTRAHVLYYTILLFVVSLLPWLTAMSGYLYLGGAVVLGLGFLYYAIRLMNPPNERFAMEMFGYSVLYLMALFAFLLADHYLSSPALLRGPAATIDFVPA